MACLMNYAIQCRDITTGEVGCFIFCQDHWAETGEFKAVSAVFSDLPSFFRGYTRCPQKILLLGAHGMKMGKEQYEQLKSDIRTVGNSLSILHSVQYSPQGVTGLRHMYALLAVVNANRAYDDAWFALAGRARVLPYSGRELYDVLDDVHIATALRRIRKELLAESEHGNV